MCFFSYFSSLPSLHIISKCVFNFKFYLESCEFPLSAIMNLRENKFKKFEETNYKITQLKKRIKLLLEKLKDRKVEDIFIDSPLLNFNFFKFFSHIYFESNFIFFIK